MLTAAAVEIQCAARRFISMRKLVRLRKEREELVAKSIRDELNSNAKKLQCIVRRHIARKMLKMMKKQKMHHKLAMSLIIEKTCSSAIEHQDSSFGTTEGGEKNCRKTTRRTLG